MLKLSAMEGRECAYYALPFNPYGTRADYSHPFVRRWFDVQDDHAVLIGAEFWDRLGGDGTWEAMLAIAEHVGSALRDRVLDEYLLEG